MGGTHAIIDQSGSVVVSETSRVGGVVSYGITIASTYTYPFPSSAQLTITNPITHLPTPQSAAHANCTTRIQLYLAHPKNFRDKILSRISRTFS